MTAQIYSVKIGGQAGQGVKAAGLTLAKIAVHSGYHIHTYTEFPSLIRGGHNVMQILISESEVSAPLQKTDLLIALDQNSLTRHQFELTSGGGVLYDSTKNFDTSGVKSDVNLFPIPLSQLAGESGGPDILINTVALGAVTSLLNGNLKTLHELVRTEFKDKSEQIISINLKAAELGYNFAASEYPSKLPSVLKPLDNFTPQMIINGNEAAALGAIAGGVQFAAIYPMSPISNILHVLAANQEKFGYIYKQPEDEISAVNMAIGASFAGARSMTATSGGGFCLMTEGLGLGAMTETPLVIINGMRPGPATGLPTWSGQGDLQFALHAHQGDFPRIVLAAGDAKETFELTRTAFNLADVYQTPVIVLIDKNICEDDHSYPVFTNSDFNLTRGKITLEPNPQYARYFDEPDGISTRTYPGRGNFFIGNSYEHTDVGFDTEEPEVIVREQQKRSRKLATCIQNDMPIPALYGPENADLTIVSWGSNKGSILEALKNFPNVNFLHLTWLSPFPIQAVKNILSRAKKVLDIECNFTGQLAGLIREQTGFEIPDKFLKYDGRPIFPEEIVLKINSLLPAHD